MPDTLKAALLSVLRPLVRYLVGQGCTFGTLVDLLKMVYVGETLRHYTSTGGRPLTDSRLTLMTGIHRKEVKRLREMLLENDMNIELRADASVASRVVALWCSEKGFQAADQSPLALPMRADNGCDFETLTRLAKADMRPRAILDELVRAGVAQIDSVDGRIALLRMAYVSDIPEDKLAFLGQNVGDHLQSALHNLEHTPPLIERALFFDALSSTALPVIQPQLEQAASALLIQAHELVSQVEQQHPLTADTPTCRIRLGVYYYQEKIPGEAHP